MHDATDDTHGGRRQLALCVLLLVVAALVLHWPRGGFKADDYPTIRYASDWGRVADDFTGVQYGLRFFSFYRPLITLSLACDHALFGVEPLGFLWMNWLAFVVSVVLLFLILVRLRMFDAGVPVSFGVAMLWILHPDPVYSLRWVVGRVDTHVTVLVLAALYLHVRSRAGGPRWPVWLVTVLAMMTKESAVGIPLLAIGVDFLALERARRSSVRWLGCDLVGLPLMLLVPAFFVFRRLVLGVWIGGYGFMAAEPAAASAIVRGLWNALGAVLVPGLGSVAQHVAAALLLCAAIVWIASSGRRRWASLAAAVLVSAGVFAPLAQLLASQNQRYGYFACLWSLVVWAAIAARIANRRAGLALALTLLPGFWLVPAERERHRDMTRHDTFNESLVAAMRSCATQLPPGEPVVLGGSPELANHPQRFLWGLGAVLRPPFWHTPRDVVSLRKLQPAVVPASIDLVTRGLPAWVEVMSYGAQVRAGAPGKRAAAEAVGFAGRLEVSVMEQLAVPEERSKIGYRIGRAYGGTVTVCSTVGSLVLSPGPPDGDVLSLADVLVSNAGWRHEGPALPAVNILWNAADLDPESPWFLVWGNADESRVARLPIGDGFARWYYNALSN